MWMKTRKNISCFVVCDKLLFNIGRDGYAAMIKVHPTKECPGGGTAWRGAYGTGFGDRNTKTLTAQKQKDRLYSRNNPEGFFRSGRLNIRLEAVCYLLFLHCQSLSVSKSPANAPYAPRQAVPPPGHSFAAKVPSFGR